MTKARTHALLALLACSLFPAALHGQDAEQQVVLARTSDGLFVEATPDGALSTSAYVVPAGQELCLTDIVWAMNGPPNESLTMHLVNASVDGTSSWGIWSVTATMNNTRDASGLGSFQSGPKITSNGRIRAVFPAGLSGAAFTLYGKQRAVSTAPCS